MTKRRRCPYCRCLFSPDPRVKDRQRTCGQHPCRKEQKRRNNERWRSEHPEYFRGMYAHQKELYGTRAAYKRAYRKKHPEYVRRNAAYVRECRKRQRQGSPGAVSHTSRDIFVSVCQKEAYEKTARVSPTSCDGA